MISSNKSVIRGYLWFGININIQRRKSKDMIDNK